MSKNLYSQISFGDVCKVKLSDKTKNLCGGHQMFKREGQILEMLCLYSEFYNELYFTDDGITYTSRKMKSEVVEILGNIFDNLKDSKWATFYNVVK